MRKRKPDGEPKHDHRDARPHPRQKRALVGEVVASSIGILRHASQTTEPALFHRLRIAEWGAFVSLGIKVHELNE